LRDVIDRTETLTGCAIERAYVDKGYRDRAQNPRRVFISGRKRGVFGVIKRELRRRSAIEPMIGDLKAEGHLERCWRVCVYSTTNHQFQERSGMPALRTPRPRRWSRRPRASARQPSNDTWFDTMGPRCARTSSRFQR
jgi:hypothetical protein